MKTSASLLSTGRSVSRRAWLCQSAGAIAAAGVLAAPRHSIAKDRRPDDEDPLFWTAPRSVRVHNANTGVTGEYLYWADGNYVMDGYYGLSAALLDHREAKAVQLQPGVFDLMYATQRWYQQAERKPALTRVTSGYRTPKTNRLVGGAPGGRHPEGAALDGGLQGVSLNVYARMLMAFQMGGVGLYARHVHWDVGRPPAFWFGGKVEG